jgi:hypothetical protein
MKRCPACRRVYDRDAKFCQIDGTILADFNSDPLIGRTIAKRYRWSEGSVTALARSTWPPSSRPGVSVAVKILVSELHCDDDAPQAVPVGRFASRRLAADLLISSACMRLTGRTTDEFHRDGVSRG